MHSRLNLPRLRLAATPSQREGPRHMVNPRRRLNFSEVLSIRKSPLAGHLYARILIACPDQSLQRLQRLQLRSYLLIVFLQLRQIIPSSNQAFEHPALYTYHPIHLIRLCILVPQLYDAVSLPQPLLIKWHFSPPPLLRSRRVDSPARHPR